MSGLQIKVARVAAGLTHKQLADQSNVAISTVRRVEVEDLVLKSKVETLSKIVTTLQQHGVNFRFEDGKFIWEKATIE